MYSAHISLSQCIMNLLYYAHVRSNVRLHCAPMCCAVKVYIQHMGEVDFSDDQILSVSRKTIKWYNNLFCHFVDIAIDKSSSLSKEEERPHQRLFQEELCEQLADCSHSGGGPPQART